MCSHEYGGSASRKHTLTERCRVKDVTKVTRTQVRNVADTMTQCHKHIKHRQTHTEPAIGTGTQTEMSVVAFGVSGRHRERDTGFTRCKKQGEAIRHPDTTVVSRKW